MSVTIDFKEVENLSLRLRRFPAIWSRTERLAVGKAAEELLKEIQVHASGSPGPNIQTGSYRASWFKVDMGVFRGWKVATFAPQAARLEYGFTGTDSLGRNYAQPARPHVRPAMEKIRPLFRELYGKAAIEAWES